MSADPFSHGRYSDRQRNPPRRPPHAHARARSGWTLNARPTHGTGGQVVPPQSMRDFVHSEGAQQALESLSERIAESLADAYVQLENSLLRRKLHEAEQERSKLEQDNEDLRRALEATRKVGSHDLRAEFNELAEQWHDETGHMSSAISFTQHPAYLRIIGMGPAVVPLILEDLQRTQAHWFVALRLITGENPIKPEDKGKVQRLADSWIAWGRERGLV